MRLAPPGFPNTYYVPPPVTKDRERDAEFTPTFVAAYPTTLTASDSGPALHMLVPITSADH